MLYTGAEPPWLSEALPAFTNLFGRYIAGLAPSMMRESMVVQAFVFKFSASVTVAYSLPPRCNRRPSGNW